MRCGPILLSLPVKQKKNQKRNEESARSVLTEATVKLVSDKKLCSVNEVIDCEHFSDLHKLFRITAHVKRFIVNLRSRICKNEIALNGSLTVAEVEMAKTLWIKHAQQLIFQDAKFKQMQISLGVYKDDSGALRCSGRIQNSLYCYLIRQSAQFFCRRNITLLVLLFWTVMRRYFTTRLMKHTVEIRVLGSERQTTC